MAEIGLVLAILPLLISAAEHYDDVLKPFKRYKNYAVELKRYQNELASEQVIFDSEMHLLLASVTTYEIAEEMIDDHECPYWKDPALEEKLSKWLGSSLEACMNVINLIDDDLIKLRKEAYFMDTVPSESPFPTDVSQKNSWKLRVGRKLKWCFSQSQLDNRLRDLRRHVKVFQRHTNQAKRMAQQQSSNQHQQAHVSRTETITQHGFVHEAAAQLCQALILACKSHQEHRLHFQLETVKSTSITRSFIRFHMAFIHELSSSGASPIWVTIESEYGIAKSIIEETRIYNIEPAPFALENPLKRPNETATTDSQRKKIKFPGQKSVRFSSLTNSMAESSNTTSTRPTKSCLSTILSTSWIEPKSAISKTPTGSDGRNGTTRSKRAEILPQMQPTASLSSSLSTTPPISVPVAPLPDFCQQRDLCQHIAEHSRTGCGFADGCIGYLGEKSAPSRRVLLTPRSSSEETNPVSLAQLISLQPQSRRFLYLDSIRLAKRLASSILEYHATPVLEEGWRSEDVVFYVASTKESQTRLTNPHLSVHMKDRQTSQALQQPKPMNRDKQIRNLYTYRLGVILLELTCQAPLSKLKQEDDEIASSEKPSTDFEAANFISETLSTDMGIPFQKIVQKCLNCDFGCGTDLNDTSLQAAFHKDVVCGLATIEEKLSALQLED